MRQTRNFLALISLCIFVNSACLAATLTGTVKGPDGAPFEGAFVQAQNTKTRMSFIVLTNSQGRYRVEKLPAGEYRVTSRATGFRTDQILALTLTENQDASLDLALQKAPIRWNELSIYQAKQLLPASTGKDTFHATVSSATDSRRAWLPCAATWTAGTTACNSCATPCTSAWAGGLTTRTPRKWPIS